MRFAATPLPLDRACVQQDWAALAGQLPHLALTLLFGVEDPDEPPMYGSYSESAATVTLFPPALRSLRTAHWVMRHEVGHALDVLFLDEGDRAQLRLTRGYAALHSPRAEREFTADAIALALIAEPTSREYRRFQQTSLGSRRALAHSRPGALQLLRERALFAL